LDYGIIRFSGRRAVHHTFGSIAFDTYTHAITIIIISTAWEGKQALRIVLRYVGKRRQIARLFEWKIEY